MPTLKPNDKAAVEMGSRPTRSRTMLVVEDDRALRELYTQVLEERGFTVLAAAGVDEAISRVSQHSQAIDLAILDMTLHGADRSPNAAGSGLDLAVALENIQAGVRILYITGYSSALAMEAIRQHSPNQVLFKPFTVPDFVSRVRLLLGVGTGKSERKGHRFRSDEA